jgi:NNMT/PNMT/TEMT family
MNDCWDEFDPRWYVNHYFGEPQAEDRQIVSTLRDLLADAALPRGAMGVDVGCGPNLYPALAMLPFCEEITLWEFATPNVHWLEREIRSFSALWDPFWGMLAEHDRYRRIDDPRAALASRALVHQGSVFGLPPHRWDLGTMLFVAESFSSERDDFDHAVTAFIRSLTPGAPFAIGFVEGSSGYRVGRHEFPAFAVFADDVHEALEPITAELDVDPISTAESSARPGHAGMILATGLADHTT